MSSIFFPEPFQTSRKRSHQADNLFLEDPYQPTPLKRGNVQYDLLEAPSTPESGIDISELSNQSPNFYSSPKEVHEGVVQMESTSLQPEQSKDGYTLLLVDEPEENYRARYESEGCRGPMKGRNGGCPTVEISSPYHNKCLGGRVRVELTGSDGTPLQSCQLDSTENDSNLVKSITPGHKITFDNLRIRRLKKQSSAVTSTRGSASSVGSSKGGTKGYSRGKQDEKMAHLLFTANVKTATGSEIVLKVQSQPIYLNASHEPPEIHRVVPQYGCSGDTVAIIGTRMHSPRVSFILNIHGKEEEVLADIDKDVSHQNALVIKVPQITPSTFANSNSVQAFIRVTAGKGDRSGKEPLKSQKMPFTCMQVGICKECWITQTQFNYQSKNFTMPYYSPVLPSKPPKLPTLVPVIVPTTTHHARSNSPNINVGSPNHMTSSPPPVTVSNGRIPINNVESIFSKTDFMSYQQLPPTASEHSPPSATDILSTWPSDTTSQSGQPASPCTPLIASSSCQSLDVPTVIQHIGTPSSTNGGADTLPGPEEFEKYLNSSGDIGIIPPPAVTSLSSAPRYHGDVYYSQHGSAFVAHTNNCS